MRGAIHAREEELAAGGELSDLHADQDALEQLSRDHYVDRLIGREEFMAARQPLEERIAARRRRLSRRAGTRMAVDAATDPATRWAEADVDTRRALLGELIESIEVTPASRRGAPFEPDRATIKWRY